ncbi:D-alanyl-D-alanine carboxypeptidase family protein [Wukongibacter baidiensis]|uniref:D-alanyl-D-alanine carboxypeptidase family protein n=1 Tax=Wukongibacter baidiensis TaxID=1723361 RepID=UPI003D7F3B67
MRLKKTLFKALMILLIFSLIPANVYANSAECAIVMEVKTGRILYSKNINVKRPMASTTKIMTALVAMENRDLESIVNVPDEAVGVEGSSIYLRNDEKVKLKDLLYGLMLRSGNDSAVAIAHHVSGSVEDFSNLMNKKAKKLGANNSNFKNPHGLHHKDHYTTAYDLALITRAALLNENFKKIVSSKRWIAERDGYNTFYNKNKTLSQFKGGDGVKTGYTKVAGRCLVTSATRNGMQVLCVVLNDPNWFNDCYSLMGRSFEKYQAYKVLDKNFDIKGFTVDKGEKDKSYMRVKKDIIIPVTESERDKVRTVIECNEKYQAPIARSQKLGKAKIYIGDKLITTADLYSREDIDKNTFMNKIKNFFNKD